MELGVSFLEERSGNRASAYYRRDGGNGELHTPKFRSLVHIWRSKEFYRLSSLPFHNCRDRHDIGFVAGDSGCNHRSDSGLQLRTIPSRASQRGVTMKSWSSMMTSCHSPWKQCYLGDIRWKGTKYHRGRIQIHIFRPIKRVNRLLQGAWNQRTFSSRWTKQKHQRIPA